RRAAHRLRVGAGRGAGAQQHHRGHRDLRHLRLALRAPLGSAPARPRRRCRGRARPGRRTPVIRPALPYLLLAVLAGLGTYGILARRHAVLVLIGVELVLGAAGLLLVTVGQTGLAAGDPHASGQVLTLFLITIAAAEVVVALAVLLALFRA